MFQSAQNREPSISGNRSETNCLWTNRLVEIAGRYLHIDTADAQLTRTIDKHLEHYYFTNSPTPPKEGFILKIGREPLPHLPPDWQNFEIQDGWCYTNGSSYYIAVGESLMSVDTAAKVAEAWIPRHKSSSPSGKNSILITYLLQAGLRQCGLYEIHAASVIEPKTNCGALLIGESGSGKSTLALQLIRYGFRYLGDDSVLLIQDEEGVMAKPFRRKFMVTPATIETCNLSAFTEALETQVSRHDGKHGFQADLAFADAFADNCKPTALFFVSQSRESTTRVEPLSVPATLMRLISYCPWSCYDTAVAGNYLQALGNLAKQSKGYQFFAGADVIEFPEQVTERLSTVIQK